MKVYQLMMGHRTYDGYFTTPGRIYTSKEEAEKALAFSKSIPENPYRDYDIEEFIEEIDVEDKFVPWISEEKIKEMQREVDEFLGYYEDEDYNYCLDDNEDIPF